MKIGVLGAGSVGCYLGGRLLHAGMDVTLVGRSGLQSEIAQYGMSLSDYHGRTFRIPASAVNFQTDPAALAGCGCILITVKGKDTENAGRMLQELLVDSRVVVSFQNGVRNAPLLKRLLPHHHVLAGMVSFHVLRRACATFHHGTSGHLVIEQDAEAGAMLAKVLTRSGFRVALRDDMEGVQWGKLLVNLNNAVNALAGVPLAEEFRDPKYRKVFGMAVQEGLRAVRAAGIRPAPYGAVFPAWVPFFMNLPNWIFLRVAASLVKIDPRARSSMWDDLQRSRKTEIDDLNGEIVRLAQKYHTPAPVNHAILHLVKRAEEVGRGSPNIASDTLWKRVVAARRP